MTRKVLQQALEALITAEAGLADIGDADREPTDDLAWCEERAAQALAKPRQAISTLHKALAQPEEQQSCDKQEPVGTLNISRFKGHLVNHDFDYFGELSDCTYSLYTSPPQREWAGLTDEDMDFLYPHGASVWVQETVKIIEAKLKEKNA